MKKRKRPISDNMRRVLGYVADGRDDRTGCWTMSAHGGRASTLYALLYRGLIRHARSDESGEPAYFGCDYRITEAGIAALGRNPEPDPDRHLMRRGKTAP